MRTLVPALLLAACSEQEFTIHPHPEPPSDLAITGRACHPVQRIWLEDALVYTHLYDDADTVYDSRDDTTDESGRYTLAGLVGDKDYEIHVQVGHDVVDKFIVRLGQADLEIPPAVCAGDVSLEVAVITGAYDELAPLLEQIGVTGVTVIDGQVSSEIVDLLTDPGAMARYDALFFDGGHREDGVVHGAGPVDEVRDNLRAYVQAGGAVFVSDWAYDVVESAWPDRVDFFGDDAVPDAAQVGEAGTINARVADPALAQAVGADTVRVSYDLAVWPIVEGTGASVTTYLTGDAPWRDGFSTGTVRGSPLLVGFDDGAGRVVYTTYRNAANGGPEMLGILITLIEALSATPNPNDG